MPTIAVRRSGISSTLSGLLASVVFLGSLGAQGQRNDTTPSETQSQTPFQIKVASNLVVVRVVVRDAKGIPVLGLKKEDFHVFDRGKEQTIAQFDTESSAATPALRGKFLALYFDDLNTSESDMMQVRDAADKYLASNVQPEDRVAIFTSGKMLTDFTTDPKQLHDALFKLHASVRALNRVGECPQLSDYQAQQIARFEDDQTIDEWKVALDEMKSQCPNPNPVPIIQMLARDIESHAEILARSNLKELEQVVNYISHMPGQRTIVLVSPGFPSQSEQYQLDRIIDRALRSQTVISSLDPRGLALLMRESNLTKGYNPSAGSGVIGAMQNTDSWREQLATDVLFEAARGTGGVFFHNNNDLKAGFGALAGSAVYYILAFAPDDVKADGKFHAVKVTLPEQQKGMTIQARRGYFAPRNEAEAEADARQQAVAEAEAQAQEQIREAILSKTQSQDLPVVVGAKLSEGKGNTRELSLFAHLDAKPLHFHKDGEHNLNTVTFVSAIFDQKENLVMFQQRRASVDLPDAQLAELFKAGVDVDMKFQLPSGIYRIREVVTDSEEHHMTKFSRNVKIP
jgi:VWFA-related protein